MESLEHRALLALVTVDVGGASNVFSPSSITIHQGDTVEWVWQGGFHSTVSVAGTAEQWSSSATSTVGTTFDHTFTNLGTFAYYCSIHGSDNGDQTASGMSGTITVVPAVTLDSITVTPANSTISPANTQQYTAMGHFSDSTTADITNEVTWSSSNTAVATIANTGLATGVAAGTSTIAAAQGAIAGSTTLTVNAASLMSIAVTPTNPGLAKGLAQQFAAMGTFSDGSSRDVTRDVTWASSNTEVATISNTGLATGVVPGTSAITATEGGITGGPAILTVTPATLEMIMVSPTNPSVPQGQTEPFMAIGMYSDNSTQDLTTQVTWASSNTAVATITPAGVAAAVGVGQSSISASLDGMSVSTQLTVTTPAPPPPPPVTVTVVQLTKKKGKVTGITVDFSGAVNPAEASSIGIYALTVAGKHNSFVGRGAKPLRLKSAAYNAALHQVILTPRKPFALTKPVELTVQGRSPSGLQDSVGRFIDGADDAEFVLSRKGVTTTSMNPVRSGRAGLRWP